MMRNSCAETMTQACSVTRDGVALSLTLFRESRAVRLRVIHLLRRYHDEMLSSTPSEIYSHIAGPPSSLEKSAESQQKTNASIA